MTVASPARGLFGLLGTPTEIRDFYPFLKWLIYTVATIFGFWLLWHYGLLQLMLNADRSYVSFLILVLYAMTCGHCLHHVWVISRETNIAHRARDRIVAGVKSYSVVGDRVVTDAGDALPDCRLTGHIRNLVLKARLQRKDSINQTLLLRGLADTFRGPAQLGSFASDSLLKLGLLGTIIGFILMLIPIGTLDSFDPGAMKNSMRTMGDGMAIAMYTTLAGLVASILVKLQYMILDEASAYLFGLATDLTEVFVISTLEREANG